MYRVVYNIARTLNKNVGVKSANSNIRRHLEFAPVCLSRGRFLSGVPSGLDEVTYTTLGELLNL